MSINIENSSHSQIKDYLIFHRIIDRSDNVLSTESPGEGNMNFVLRVVTKAGSIILKQSKPYVQKYPSIAAPIERIHSEAAFYNCLVNDPLLKSQMPKILHFDEENHLLIMEDLGQSSDFMNLYRGQILSEAQFQSLMAYLNCLHKHRPLNFTSNFEMKILNHFHIFVFPFQKNEGFDLNGIQHGLAEVSERYVSDKSLNEKIQFLGSKYLSTQDTLIHGDFYPGSWLNTASGMKVIDPEFCYLGFPEFDLGVMKAHLKMTNHPISMIHEMMPSYGIKVDENLMNQFAGVEIMRRLLGVAQLPIRHTLEWKTSIIEDAYELILN